MRVAIYIRVSTDEQASSAEAQESGALAWCAAQGHTVVATYRDIGHSGAEWVRRPGVAAIEADVRRSPRPWDILVVRDLDRLGRDGVRLPLLLSVLADHDAQMVEWSTGTTVQIDALGRMIAGVRAGLAEIEREMIAHRTRTALRARAERGLSVGGIAYGYRHRRDPDGVRDVIDEGEAAIVREVYERAARGESVRAIARDLNAREVPSPRAGRRGTGTWAPSALWEIVRSPRYRGRIVWGEVGARYKGGTRRSVEGADVVERDAPELAIVDDALWHRAQSQGDVARHSAGRAPKRGAASRYLLVGLAVCDHCGGPIGSARQLSGGVSVPAYCCLWHRDRGASVCPATYCRVAARLDATVIDWLLSEVLDADALDRAVADARRLAASTAPDPHAAALRAEEREHALAVTRLTSAIEAGAGEVSEIAERLAARSRQLADVRARIAREVAASTVVPIDLEARLRAAVAGLRDELARDPSLARGVLDVVLVGRVRVSQPVRRGPVWLSAEAVPGALLASPEQGTPTGYGGDPNGTRTYPVGPRVQLRREVA